MATKSKSFSVTLSEEAMNLIKAEALKDDRSARSWLDRYIRASLPLQPQSQPKPTPTPNKQQPSSERTQPKPQPAHNLDINTKPLYSDPELEARRLATLAEWDSPDEDE